jgi:benzoyl-CoA reductase subunit B
MFTTRRGSRGLITKVGGVYDTASATTAGRSYLATTLAATRTNLPSRRPSRKYIAIRRGRVIKIESCNFSAGQLMILREVEKRTGVPGAFIESDLVDPRYFSAANIKNRLESYFQMIKQKRARAATH